MNSQKSIFLLILTLLLAVPLGSMSYLFPGVTPANAVSCPTGGPTNGCLTVSLDVNSRSTTVATPTCAVPSGQSGVCDTSITTSASNVTTFRVGAILNATSSSRATSTLNCGGVGQFQCGVFGWQFAINYDPTIVTPQGDPTKLCSSYPDCPENTVWVGSQTGVGTVNWAGYGSSQAIHPFFVSENLTAHTAHILVGYSFINPATPVEISARTVLANVAFELVGLGTVTFRVSDVIFVDENAVQIPGIKAAPTTPCVGGSLPSSTCGAVTDTVTNDPPHAHFTATQISAYAYAFTSTSTDLDGRITSYYWDFGDGTQDLNASGPTIILHDYNNTCAGGCPNGLTLPGRFSVTLRVADNLGATGAARDFFGKIVSNNQPSHAVQTVLADQRPSATFSFSPSNPILGQTVSFNATTSTDPDGTIVSYAWDFGDGGTGSGVATSHLYSSSGSFVVTLTVTDDAGLTKTTSATVPISSGSGSHASLFQWGVRVQFKKFSISNQGPSEPIQAFAVNDGNRTIWTYVVFVVTGDSGVNHVLYTQVVQLSPGQAINGNDNAAFAASFIPNATGTYFVRATVFYSAASAQPPIGDPSFNVNSNSASTSFIVRP